MRLTLRTLLAYLDDTLEAGEIKQIGQKVAESDAAQELIARIKQVTRRRRLTTPSDGGPGERFDPNIVAEYLDNELSTEQVAELEKLCLESDVHLAEIAASHQILTLVLGEPALIPPTAKRRMYALVHGRKPKVAARKTGVVAGAADGHVAEGEGDETLLIGLPLFRKAPWLRWVVPLAAVLLLAVLGGVLWKNLSPDKNPERVASNGKPGDAEKDLDKDKKGKRDPDTDKKGKKDPNKNKKIEKDPNKEKKVEKPPIDPGKLKIDPPAAKPNMERREAGKLTSNGQVLVHQIKRGGDWKRIPFNGAVSTGDTLVSLPSYRSEIKTNKGVGLMLWGSLPEFFQLPLLESAVTLHHNPAFDLDVTLKRGRIYLTNRKDKGPAHVRLRFWHGDQAQVWDVTLEEPDTMVGAELWSVYLPELKPLEGEEPLVQVVLYVAKGRAQVKIEGTTHGDLSPPPGRCMFYWNNKTKGVQGPGYERTPVALWNPEMAIPAQKRAQGMKAAREELANQLGRRGKPVDAGLLESMEDTTAERRVLGIRCLGAIGDVKELLDALGNSDAKRADVRRAALFALKNWLSRGAENGRRLFDVKEKVGLLKDRNLDAETCYVILYLLYGPNAEARKQAETYSALIAYLKHDRLEVRELAIWNLQFLLPERSRDIEYNPAGGKEQLEQAYTKWKKLIPDGKVPLEQTEGRAPGKPDRK